MGDLSAEELAGLDATSQWMVNARGASLTEDDQRTVGAKIGRAMTELQRHRAAQAASTAHAAMLLLDGLTGRRSANVFEAARNAESVIAGIPGRPVVQEPSARGRELHDAAIASTERVREIVMSVVSVEVSAAVAIDIANRVAALLVSPPSTSTERVREVVSEAADSELEAYFGTKERPSMRRLAGDIADRVAAQLAAPPIVSAADRAEIEQWLVGRAQDGHACEALDRLLHALDAAPPDHVCPVPCGLGPEDVDALTELAVHAEMVDWPRAREALDRILSAHRPPGARS